MASRIRYSNQEISSVVSYIYGHFCKASKNPGSVKIDVKMLTQAMLVCLPAERRPDFTNFSRSQVEDRLNFWQLKLLDHVSEMQVQSGSISVPVSRQPVPTSSSFEARREMLRSEFMDISIRRIVKEELSLMKSELLSEIQNRISLSNHSVSSSLLEMESRIMKIWGVEEPSTSVPEPTGEVQHRASLKFLVFGQEANKEKAFRQQLAEFLPSLEENGKASLEIDFYCKSTPVSTFSQRSYDRVFIISRGMPHSNVEALKKFFKHDTVELVGDRQKSMTLIGELEAAITSAYNRLSATPR